MLIAAAAVAALLGAAAPLRAQDRAAEDRVDAAVERALKFMVTQSKQDPNTKVRYFQTGLGRNTGVASLVCMAFMARGHVPGEGPYGDFLNEVVDFVVAAQQPSGLLVLPGEHGHGPFGYEHGISTLMLAEVVGMTSGPRAERVRKALARAVPVIVEAQKLPKDGRNGGGWRYQPDSRDADLSVTAWQLMALRACANAGMPIPEDAMKKAVGYVTACESPGKGAEAGGFGYQPGHGAVPAMTGAALVAIEICAKHDTPQARRGAEYLMRTLDELRWGSYPHWFYAIYYTSQAMYQVKGPDNDAKPDPNSDWERYRRKLEKVILEKQMPDGSWPEAPGDGGGAGPAYRTAMCVLALSVQARLLPIYQR
jgi:hypothetical protein